MFTENKYYRWYLSITSKDDEAEYVEKHHIIPRSMGGTNEKSNIVKLTFRKHFLAHWLLSKCTEGLDQKKMLKAIGLMRCNRGGKFTAWQFELAKRAAIEGRKGVPSPKKGRKIPEAQRLALIGRRKGIKLSEEHKAAISAGGMGRIVSDDTKAKIGLANKGRKLSPERCAAIGNSKRGTKQAPEVCKKVSASLLGNTRKLGFKDPEETILAKRLAQLSKTEAMNGSVSGLRGVVRISKTTFRARTKFKGKVIDVGIFNCPAAAHFAYLVKRDEFLNSLIEGSVP